MLKTSIITVLLALAYCALVQADEAFTKLGDEPTLNCSALAPYCTCEDNNSKINCQNFDNFKQLNFKAGFHVSSVRFQPAKKLVLNNDLNLEGLFFQLQSVIQFGNIDSIDYEATVFDNLKNSRLQLYFYNSNFRFTYQGKSLEDPEVCKSAFESQTPPFGSNKFNTLLLVGQMIYSRPICPVIFRHSDIITLEVNQIDVLDGDLQLKFLPVPSHIALNSSLAYLSLSGPRLTITSDLVNPDVFRGLKSISISSEHLSTIASGAFEPFDRLKYLYLFVRNFVSFIRSSTNEWMTGLNKNVTININDTSLVNPGFFANNALRLRCELRYNYDFPDSDLCYFKNLPHQHAIIPEFRLNVERLNCTCTLAFLYQYVYKILPDEFPYFMQDCKADFLQILAACDLPSRLQQCPVSSAGPSAPRSPQFMFSMMSLFTILICIQTYILV